MARVKPRTHLKAGPASVSGSSASAFVSSGALSSQEHAAQGFGAVDPGAAAAPPVWSIPSTLSYAYGEAVSLDLDTVCTDPNGDPITYSIEEGTLPSGLALSGVRNNLLSGTTGSSPASEPVRFGASDGVPGTVTGPPFTTTGAIQIGTYEQQEGTFEIEYDVITAALGLNLVTFLSNGTPTDFAQMACSVRFNTSNQIDVRRGSGYDKDVTVTYSAGQTYRIRIVVDMTTNNYSVYVNGTLIASDYAFRTGADTSAFNTMGASDASTVKGSTITNAILPVPVVTALVTVSVFEEDLEEPDPPDAAVATNITSNSVRLTLPTNVEVDHSYYQLWHSILTTATGDYVLLASPILGTGIYQVSQLTPELLQHFRLKAVDFSGNISDFGANVSITTLAAEEWPLLAWTSPNIGHSGSLGDGLTLWTGGPNITVSGTYENFYTQSIIRVQAPDVTLRNWFFDGQPTPGDPITCFVPGFQLDHHVGAGGQPGLLVENCTFSGTRGYHFRTSGSAVMRRCKFTDQLNDIWKVNGQYGTSDDSVLFESNYCRGMGLWPDHLPPGETDPPHCDGNQIMRQSTHPVIYRGNTIDTPSTMPLVAGLDDKAIAVGQKTATRFGRTVYLGHNEAAGPGQTGLIEYNYFKGGKEIFLSTEIIQPLHYTIRYNTIGLAYRNAVYSGAGWTKYGNRWWTSGLPDTYGNGAYLANAWRGPWTAGALLPGESAGP
jgi:hypothetical protein